MPEDTVPPSEMEIPPAPRMVVLKVAVIVMGVLLLAGFGLVVATIVNRASHPSTAAVVGPGGRFGVSEINVDPGDRVRTLTMNEDRMAIHIAGEKGEEIVIVNVKTGAELGRFRLLSLTGLAANGK
ncbi:MAG TPA: hypothetical protein VGN05_03735 [Parvibaculum sp.]|jgi:hypothetical protein